MSVVQSSKLRNHILKAVRIAAWTIAFVVLLIAEIFVFENWGSRLDMRILGLVITVAASVMVGLGLYRLKVAAESEPQASFWPGMRAVFSGALLIMGCSLGTYFHYYTSHVLLPTVVENGF